MSNTNTDNNTDFLFWPDSFLLTGLANAGSKKNGRNMNPIRRIREQYGRLRKEDDKYRYEAAYDDEGREVIELQLSSLRDAFSRFSPTCARRINPEVKDYLNSQNRQLGPLVINVRNADIADREGMRNAFRKTVYDEFHYDCAHITKRMRFNLIKSWSLIVFGILIIVFSVIAALLLDIFTPENNVIFRTVDIFAWVIMWEAFDGLLFTRHTLRMEYLRAARLRLAEFTFTE